MANGSVLALYPADGARTNTPSSSAKFLLGRSKTDSQSVGFSLNGSHLGLQSRMPFIPKGKVNPESGFRSRSNFFTFNNMAERVGFEPTLPFRVNTLSKRAPSATRPSLRREIRLRKLSHQRVSATGRTNETRYFLLRFYGPDGRTASRRLSDHL